MDAMSLAQLKRQAVWYAEELRRLEHELEVSGLALENDKKKVEELRKKVIDSKRKNETFNQEIVRAQEEVRKAQFKASRS